jgi:hypothetical protein
VTHNERNFLRRGPGEIVSLTVEGTKVLFVAQKGGRRQGVTENYEHHYEAVDRFDEMVMVCTVDYGFQIEIVEYLA